LNGSGRVFTAWLPFRKNPPAGRGSFSRKTPSIPDWRTHKIQRLSAQYRRTIYAVEIEDDLRATFYLDGETVVSLTIGTHAIYKG